MVVRRGGAGGAVLVGWALGHRNAAGVLGLAMRVGNNSGFHPEGQLRLYLELNGHRVDTLAYSLLRSDI